MRSASEPVGRDVEVLELVYGLVDAAGKWPTYRAVDLRLDRDLGIADTQAALLGVSAAYLRRPWQSHGFNDADEVRLTLPGIAKCEGGLGDLEFAVRYLKWAASMEQSSSVDAASLVVSSRQFVECLEWNADQIFETRDGDGSTAEPRTVPDEASDPEPSTADLIAPDIAEQRVRLVRLRVATEMIDFWSGAGHQPKAPWDWNYTINRQRIRVYRELRDAIHLLDLEEPKDPARAEATRPAGETIEVPGHADQVSRAGDADLVRRPADRDGSIEVLLTVLRPEIANVSGDLVHARLYDEAIFAAYRHVEAALQKRTGNPSIGDALVKIAFLESAHPIKVSDRAGDSERLVQLFSGPIGLFKGDRSHKDTPALPCRSRNECIRQLAHASSLLDLLDRDRAIAPALRGYDHDPNGRTLKLWVERATPTTEVLLDSHPGRVVGRTSGTITLNVFDVPPGEHLLALVDGTRQGPERPVWLLGDSGPDASWYRVEKIDIPLYGDADGVHELPARGVRLAVMESRILQQRVVPTAETYQVGDYVSWAWGGGQNLGPVWAREHPDDPLIQIFNSTMLFSGIPEAPAHAARTVRVSLQPERLRLRVGEKVPLRAIRQVTDGTAAWSELLDSPNVESDDEKIAAFSGGVLFAKQPGSTTVRLVADDLYAETAVHVASHPRGTLTDWITGLPTVAGLAMTDAGLVISTRENALWRIRKNGKFDVVAGLPLQPPTFGGSDNIAASPNGDLAIRLNGHRDVLVLHASADYTTSRWVSPPESDSAIMACAWEGDTLVLGHSSGAIWQVKADGNPVQLTCVDGPITHIVKANDAWLVLTGGEPSHLWRIEQATPDQQTRLLPETGVPDLAAIGFVNDVIYLAEFHGGRILRLDDPDTLTPIAEGLNNPNVVVGGPDGTIYIAEFGRGAVRRILV
ncbi:TIGR02391 family protein [Longispora sp. K20-0274]|uniref:TIGR02391 family protein n=1 Tax=Longispora sp. K20-0274 TaxID=3088255 RepID=UPI00399B214B